MNNRYVLVKPTRPPDCQPPEKRRQPTSVEGVKQVCGKTWSPFLHAGQPQATGPSPQHGPRSKWKGCREVELERHTRDAALPFFVRKPSNFGKSCVSLSPAQLLALVIALARRPHTELSPFTPGIKTRELINTFLSMHSEVSGDVIRSHIFPVVIH